MKKIINSLILSLVLFSQYANAIPTLFFGGAINYDSYSQPPLTQGVPGNALGILSITSTLTASQEISPAPELVNSSLTFSAYLTDIDVSSTTRTVGIFEGGSNYDINAKDGNGNDLILGDFTNLRMIGRNGRDSGRVFGTIIASDGLLADYYGDGELIALVFNIDTTFNADMFESSFGGNINGRIEGTTPVPTIPTPGIFSLIMIGLSIFGLTSIISRRHQHY